ncbi:MAG TPA: SDR family NAD(P)-dependent oxidoreductase [Verrucomicrobiae bacterium]|nr:SDR family NAD(P)-dependent oxidoreductase [Verrucomicrobiae bacterium]
MKRNKVLITGGAGFIGANAARRFLENDWEVTVLDNLSRRGALLNLQWLKDFRPFRFVQIDLRKEKDVVNHLRQMRYDLIIHCAGQVAVTASVRDPRDDLENNILGTFNLLEAVRISGPDTFLIYTSTNKVYGGMEETKVIERNGRYEYAALSAGVSENQPLDFHSPYGCSKGAADQYVRDYSRIYGLPTVCFRQSCIYGYRQFGVEDQGWVAWFIIAHALRRPVTIFGDGKQTRDILFVDDLINAYCLAWRKREKTSGQVYNIGGGPRNQFSLRQLVQALKEESGRPVKLSYDRPRPGDQKVFVADIRKAFKDFGWRPTHSVHDGVRKLNRWVNENIKLFEVLFQPDAKPQTGRAHNYRLNISRRQARL